MSCRETLDLDLLSDACRCERDEGCDCPECMPEGCMDETPPPAPQPVPGWFLRPAARFAAARTF